MSQSQRQPTVDVTYLQHLHLIHKAMVGLTQEYVTQIVSRIAHSTLVQLQLLSKHYLEHTQAALISHLQIQHSHVIHTIAYTNLHIQI